MAPHGFPKPIGILGFFLLLPALLLSTFLILNRHRLATFYPATRTLPYIGTTQGAKGCHIRQQPGGDDLVFLSNKKTGVFLPLMVAQTPAKSKCFFRLVPVIGVPEGYSLWITTISLCDVFVLPLKVSDWVGPVTVLFLLTAR